jgi:DUF1365 family protein
VRHHRLRPREHAFAYPTYFLLLPLRSLRAQPDPALPRGRRAPVSFDDRDHGDGRADCLAWFDELLAREGIADADGEVWLHCLPRAWGRVFKPVSFWYAHRRDGSLAAVVAEVNNTFGERHCYLLAGPGLAWGREQRARKVFHVSPFCRIEGDYRFRFLRTDLLCSAGPPRTVVRIDHHDAQGPLLRTSVSGRLEPLDAAALRRAALAMPLLPLTVLARIHWHALRLWLRRAPCFAKPTPPADFVTR